MMPYFHREANNWSWVPVIGCFLGGVVGALIYVVLIEVHHDTDKSKQEERELERIITSE